VPLKVHFVPEITMSVNTKSELLWDFGDGTFSYEVEPEHTYMKPGIYNVTLTISNEFGKRTKFKPSYIIAGELPVPDFYTEITAGNVPLTVEFIDNSSGPYDMRSWDFGDGVRSILKNPVHTYTEPGLYTVSLNLSNDFGSITETKYGYIRAGFEVDLREPNSDLITPERVSGLPNIFSNISTKPGSPGSAISSFDVQNFIGLLNNK
jgi:PKD repeat protein